MKNLKPIGIPHSLILENLFARTYDATKLSEDAERVRFAYQDRGILQGNRGRPEDEDARCARGGLVLSVEDGARQGRWTSRLPVEEGDRYRLKEITFSGNKALTNTAALRRLFKTKDGDWFNRTDGQQGTG